MELPSTSVHSLTTRKLWNQYMHNVPCVLKEDPSNYTVHWVTNYSELVNRIHW